MNIRKTSRVILLNSENQVLLQKVVPLESLRWHKDFIWVAPGGQIEGGESIQECAVRELYEETGISDCEFGPILWHGTHVLKLNGVDTVFDEHFVLARIHKNYTPNSGDDIQILEQRWWGVDDLIDNKIQTFPITLPQLLLSLEEKKCVDGPQKIDFY